MLYILPLVPKAPHSDSEALPQLVCACATARLTARAITQLYDSRLRASGVEASQFGLLSILNKRPGCSQAAVGRFLSMDKTTVSRNFKVLKQKGWIEPFAGKDSREHSFRLTPLGRERLEAARPLWKAAQEQLRSKMSAEEWESMWNVLGTVRKAAQAARQNLRTGKHEYKTGEAS